MALTKLFGGTDMNPSNATAIVPAFEVVGQHDTAVTRLRRTLLRNGYFVIPLRGKVPNFSKDWPKTAATDERISDWQNLPPEFSNSGILTAQNPTIDLDIYSGQLADELQAFAFSVLCNGGAKPLIRIGMAPKRALIFRTDVSFPKISTAEYVDPEGRRNKVEVLADGQQVVVDGVHPDIGRPYTFVGNEISKCPSNALPVLTQSMARSFVDVCENRLKRTGWPTVSELNQREKEGRSTAGLKNNDPANLDQVEEVLRHVSSDGYDDWVRVGLALYHEFGDAGRTVWERWSANSSKYDPKSMDAKWRSFANVRTIGVGTVFWLARQNGWQRKPSDFNKASPAPHPASDPAEEIEPPRPLMRETPPADPFPVEALGKLLGDAVLAVHDRIRAPLAICGQAVLGAASLAVQGHADVVLPTGHKKPISNYLVTVAVTGERKSAADSEAMAPIRAHEADLRQMFDADLASYINNRAAYDVVRGNVEKQGKGAKALSQAEVKAKLDALGPAPKRPLEPTLTCDEPTIQGLERHFAVSRPSMGLFATEGGKFLAGHSMQEDNKIRTAASLSNLWDGEPIRRLRAADGSMFMPGRRLAMHLAVQPEIADIMLADRALAAQGLLSRILVTYPDSLIGTRMYRAEAAETAVHLKTYSDRIADILKKPLLMENGKQNELAPRALEMSAEAQAMWWAFADKVEAQSGRGGSLSPIAGLANKLPEHAARLAAVLALVEDIDVAVVTAGHLSQGINLAQHYAAEALRLCGVAAANVDLLRAQELLEWLHRHWGEEAVCLTDVYQWGPGAIRESATAKRLVGILEAHSWLTKIKGGAEIKGKKRREAWKIVRGSHGLRAV
jgi:hypothetical protein